MEGKKWTDFVEQEDIEKMRYHYLRRINSKSIPLVYDFRLITRGGIVKDIHLDIGLIPGTKKSIATLLDISDRKNAQDKILSKEKELATIYDNISEILYLLKIEEGNNYRFISVNSAFLSTTGLTENQVIGKYIQDVIPKPSLKLVQDNYEKAILEKRTVRWEEITEYPTGKKYGEVSITPIFDTAGNCTILIGTVHDITERVEMHKELLFKTTLLEAQLESTIDGILVVDNNGKFILFNKRFGEMWNIPGKLLESNNNKMIYDFVLNQLKNPEIFSRNIEYLYSQEDEKSIDEIEFKDGKTYESYSSPLIDLTDRNRGRIWYFRDVTESRRSKEALIESENKYSAIFNNAGDGIFLLNKTYQQLRIRREPRCKLSPGRRQHAERTRSRLALRQRPQLQVPVGRHRDRGCRPHHQFAVPLGRRNQHRRPAGDRQQHRDTRRLRSAQHQEGGERRSDRERSRRRPLPDPHAPPQRLDAGGHDRRLDPAPQIGRRRYRRDMRGERRQALLPRGDGTRKGRVACQQARRLAPVVALERAQHVLGGEQVAVRFVAHDARHPRRRSRLRRIQDFTVPNGTLMRSASSLCDRPSTNAITTSRRRSGSSSPRQRCNAAPSAVLTSRASASGVSSSRP